VVSSRNESGTSGRRLASPERAEGLLRFSFGSSRASFLIRRDHDRVSLAKSRGNPEISPKHLTSLARAVIEFPPYRLDQRAGRLWHGDHPVQLRPKTWALLRYLAERPGALVTKEELHAAVWGDVVVSDDTLTQTLGELRRALRDDPRAPLVIETVHRRGVRFIAP
jgi:DNA-binding winged helix-turn-helix (wHTH) protein